jgi:uncharacterized protein
MRPQMPNMKSSNTGIDRRRLLLAIPALLIPSTDGVWAEAPLANPNISAGARVTSPAAAKLVAAAEAQIGVTTRYNPAYERLKFPGGDVPVERGVCTDVVIRAYRVAFNADLQQLLNTDMRSAFSVYPRAWGLTAPDTNIDHRRVLNLAVYFRRQGASLPVPTDPSLWQPGDLVTQTLPNGRPHIGVVSATRAPGSPRLSVVHNIGGGTELSDILALFKATGRYRFLVG